MGTCLDRIYRIDKITLTFPHFIPRGVGAQSTHAKSCQSCKSCLKPQFIRQSLNSARGIGLPQCVAIPGRSKLRPSRGTGTIQYVCVTQRKTRNSGPPAPTSPTRSVCSVSAIGRSVCSVVETGGRTPSVASSSETNPTSYNPCKENNVEKQQHRIIEAKNAYKDPICSR